MRSSPIIGLFDTPPPARRAPSAFVTSLGVHAVVCALIYTALHVHYRFGPLPPAQRYLVRVMELTPYRPEAPRPMREESDTSAQGSRSLGRAGSAKRTAEAETSGSTQPEKNSVPAATPEALAAARVPNDAMKHQHALETLIQPDVLKEIPVTRPIPLPQVVLWRQAQQKVSVIVPPPPQMSAAQMLASLAPPNQELHIADLRLSATPYTAPLPLPRPSNTTPVATPSPEQSAQLVQSLAQRASEPTPVAIISASEIQVQQGVATLPLFNGVASAAVGPVHPGGEKGIAVEGAGSAVVSHSGQGSSGGRSGDAGSNLAADSHAEGRSSGGHGQGAGVETASRAPGAGTGSGANSGPGTGGKVAGTGAGTAVAKNGGSGPGNGTASRGFIIHGGDSGHLAELADDDASAPAERTTTRFALPRDGRYGVVVVGDAASSDEYPEMGNIWRSRLAYTVYVQVGTAQKWILQYALPPADTAADPGHLDAPWPYDITRPSIDAEAETDAIMVHGIVNAKGRFESLAVVFPTELSETAFLLRALSLWQFRPALRNGQPSPVEVLLIIPAAGE